MSHLALIHAAISLAADGGAISGDLMRSLMARMMETVTYFPDPARREIRRGARPDANGTPPNSPMMEIDIEEVGTRLALRMAFFEAHTNFSFAAVKIDGGSLDADEGGLAQVANLPRIIGSLVGSGRVTLRDLEEYYSLEDAYNIAEAMSVQAHNARVMSKKKPA